MQNDMVQAVKSALVDCMAVSKSENLLVVTDDNTFEVGAAFYFHGKEWVNNTYMILMPPADVNGQEPPDEIAQLMQKYDVVICPTSKSLTHTDAKRNACKKGVRVATLPGITAEVFARTMKADYNKIADRTFKISQMLKETKTVFIKTEKGTDLTLPISGMEPISSTGLIKERGKGGNLPSGESFLAPREGEAMGRLVIDASIAGIGLLDKEVIIDIEDGYAQKFSGSEKSKIFQQQLSDFGKAGLAVAELGIGTNDQAIITGNILEDEKVFGTVHIAFGNNITMGGTNNVGIHVDCVVTKPDMWFDNKQIMKNGQFLLNDLNLD